MVHCFMRRVRRLAAVTLVAAAGAMPIAHAEPKAGGTLISFTTGYRTLNPAVQSGAATGIPGSQIFAGLIRVGPGYKIEPYLAKSWTISDDKRTFTFHLVKNARFQDGVPITGEDVKFSLETVRANHPFGPAMFGKVSSIDVPDPSTVVLHLSQPVPGLMLSLQPLLMPILPKHVYGDSKNIKTDPRNMQNVVGSGPFKVLQNNPGEQLVLVRNDDFFIKGRPYLDKIVYRVVKDPLTLVLMLEKGTIDYAPFSGIRPTDAARIERAKGIKLTTKGYAAVGYVHYFEMNLRHKPFNNRDVRAALAHAIDTNFLSKVVFGGRVTPGTGPLHSGNPFYSPDVPHYAPDLKKAAAMLDKAGYPVGPGGSRFSFTLDVPNWSVQAHVPEAEYIKAQLMKLKIKVKLRRAPDFGTWVKRISSWDYDATMNGAFNYADPTIGVTRLFMCNNIRHVIWSNTEGYCNPELDKVLNAAAVETNFDKRKALYAKAQRIIDQDVVFINMPEDYSATVYSNRVGNLPLGPYGALAPWYDVYLKDAK